MVERRLMRRDQAGLPQHARAGLLASADGARHTTAAGASFFAFLSHIILSLHKRRISTSDKSRCTFAGDWWCNVAASTTNSADLSDTRHWGHFLTWMP